MGASKASFSVSGRSPPVRSRPCLDSGLETRFVRPGEIVTSSVSGLHVEHRKITFEHKDTDGK